MIKRMALWSGTIAVMIARGAAYGEPLAGDAAAGGAKAAMCAACHGERGNAQTPEWPKLAGQHPGYLVKQLADFKSGARGNPVMGPMAEPLTEQDMADLAAFFSTQSTVIGEARPELLSVGQRLYRGGDAHKGVPACMACHGPAGSGNPAAGYPALAGQHAAYTKAQLYAYRSGERHNDHAKMMQTVASRLSDADIEAVSSYISGLHEAGEKGISLRAGD